MERKLGRFTHCADKKEEANRRNDEPAGSRQSHHRQLFTYGENVLIVQRTGKCKDQPDPDNEPEIAHTVDEESFQTG